MCLNCDDPVSRAFLPRSAGETVTIALLLFENMTGRADQEYFADGLTEETIAVFFNLNPKRITVIARMWTMAYKQRTKSVGTIGQELGADNLIEGSVRHEEDRVRVTAQLIRVRDQSRIWSEGFERFGSDVIPIQDELPPSSGSSDKDHDSRPATGIPGTEFHSRRLLRVGRAARCDACVSADGPSAW